MVKIDLHNHLGKNGKNPGFDQTIDLIFKNFNGGGIFGICNDGPDDFRYEKFISQRGKYERIYLGEQKRAVYVYEKDITIVGVEEVEPVQGHILAVGMPVGKKICTRKQICIEDVLKKAKDFETIRIPVHPFGRDGLGKYFERNLALLEQIEGWEVYNASAQLSIPFLLPRNSNKKSEEFYNKYIKDKFDIGACAFTDGHEAEVIGKSYTSLDFDCAKTEKDFLPTLKDSIKYHSRFSSYNLTKNPNKIDAIKHVFNMAVWIASSKAKKVFPKFPEIIP